MYTATWLFRTAVGSAVAPPILTDKALTARRCSPKTPASCVSHGCAPADWEPGSWGRNNVHSDRLLWSRHLRIGTLC